MNFLLLILLSVWLVSCEDFYDPNQGLVIETGEMFKDWSEYRSAEMGLYSLQQNLVDQIVILGELRGDLMEVTENADRDLIEIYDFQVTSDNRFVSPQNFYRLIGACNSLISRLESTHPEVLSDSEPTDYDRLYGEAKCMRSWAYFNAVRIYGKVPYIWPSLTTADEIHDYVNSSATYTDSVNIRYDPGGYYNDTVYNQTVTLEKQFLDLDQVIDTFTFELENDVKAVGVIHNKDNNDATWDVTIWTWPAYQALLGQLYIYRGDLSRAVKHFNSIMYNTNSESSFVQFGVDSKFAFGKWKNIFSGIDVDEHIFTLWFDKSYQQQHDLQNYFSPIPPNQYMIKPTAAAIANWESMFNGMIYEIPYANQPWLTYMLEYGEPGDRYRGHGISYAYMRGTELMKSDEVWKVLELKQKKNFPEVEKKMAGIDTVIYKYTYGKQPYDQDANFIIYRAAGIHLYYAEIYARWEWDHNGVVKPEVNTALSVVNNGSYANNPAQMGIRGRVGFGGEKAGPEREDDDIKVDNVIYLHDPNTNEISGYHTFRNLQEKQEYLEDQIIAERARELAFEGERFYDLLRIARRRDDPSYLADKVAQKFTGAKQEAVRTFLMDESNWYIKFYE